MLTSYFRGYFITIMSDILYIIHAGGLIMYPLLFIALLAGTIIIDRTIVFFRIGSPSQNLVDNVITLSKDRSFEDALDILKNVRGPIAASLRTILEHRERPIATIERYVQEIGEEYFIIMERRLSTLDTFTTISPLLGLLGTIVGMIGAFKAISAQDAGASSDAILHGVAEALYATATGISIAIVCFVAYNYFAAKIRHITSEAETASTKLINELGE